jgi:hypothetical protein
LAAGAPDLAAEAAGADAAAAAAPPASGVAGVAAEPSLLGVDPVFVCGPGEAASTFAFEASLEEPPEQAPPMRARVLRSAT